MSFFKKAVNVVKAGLDNAVFSGAYSLGLKERKSSGVKELDQFWGWMDKTRKDLFGKTAQGKAVIDMIPKGTDITGKAKDLLAGVSGGISFGNQSVTQAWLPILVVVGFVAILIIRPFQTGARRRR